MMDKLILLLIFIPTMYILIFIHELGHYFIGITLGIPKENITIQIFKTSTPHVSLKNESDLLIEPKQTEEYITLLELFLKTDRKIYLYVAGGHALEFIFVVSLWILTNFIQIEPFSYIVHIFIMVSFLLSVIYLLIDIVISIKNKGYFGDFSSQWALSRTKAIVFYSVYFIILGLLYFHSI